MAAVSRRTRPTADERHVRARRRRLLGVMLEGAANTAEALAVQQEAVLAREGAQVLSKKERKALLYALQLQRKVVHYNRIVSKHLLGEAKREEARKAVSWDG